MWEEKVQELEGYEKDERRQLNKKIRGYRTHRDKLLKAAAENREGVWHVAGWIRGTLRGGRSGGHSGGGTPGGTPGGGTPAGTPGGTPGGWRGSFSTQSKVPLAPIIVLPVVGAVAPQEGAVFSAARCKLVGVLTHVAGVLRL